MEAATTELPTVAGPARIGCDSLGDPTVPPRTAVLGLDHSNDTGAVMYPSYQQADCTLGQDDINGIRALYP